MLIILQWVFIIPSFSQQQYFNGNTEMKFSPAANHFVFQFAESEKHIRKDFLNRLGIEFDESSLALKYVKIKTSKDIDTLRKLKSSFVKSISKLYKFDSSAQEFTFFNNLLIQFKEETSQSEINSLISQYNLRNTEKELFQKETFLFSVNATPEDAVRIANEIYATGLVNYANPDITSFDAAESNDTYYSDQWNLFVAQKLPLLRYSNIIIIYCIPFLRKGRSPCGRDMQPTPRGVLFLDHEYMKKVKIFR